MPKCPICGRNVEYLIFMKCADCLHLIKCLRDGCGLTVSCLELFYGRIDGKITTRTVNRNKIL